MKLDRSALRLAFGFTLLHGLAALIVTSIPFFYGTVGRHNVLDDVDIYYNYASRTIQGQIPYRDFPVEYPIFALPIFLIPRVLFQTRSSFVMPSVSK